MKEKIRIVYTLEFQTHELPIGPVVEAFKGMVDGDNTRLQAVQYTPTPFDSYNIKLDVMTQAEIEVPVALKRYKPVRLPELGLYRPELGAPYVIE